MSRKDELKKEIVKKQKEIESLERELKGLPEKVNTINVFVHSDRESMYEQGAQAGLSDRQLELFKYACDELELTLSVNEKGEVTIIAVDGTPLVNEE